MNIIEQLFKGALCPMEDLGYPDNPEWRKLQEQAEKLEDALLSGLSEVEKGLYSEIMALKLQADFLEIMRNFTFGFRLGSKIIIDVYNDELKKSYE